MAAEPATGVEARGAVFFGARHDLERTVTSHLFVLCPNNSGSTFLRKALATRIAALRALRSRASPPPSRNTA